MREPGKDMAVTPIDLMGLWLDLRSDEHTVLAIFYYLIGSLFLMGDGR